MRSSAAAARRRCWCTAGRRPWYAWRMLMPALARDFSVIAVDQRGIGLSDKPSDGYDLGALAGDLVALMNALGYQRFALYGTDTGYPIAYALAADHPDRVARLDLGATRDRCCGLHGPKDELGRGLGLRQERHVGGRHLHDGRLRALGHEPLQRRRDRLVLRAEQVPARNVCLPGRRARRRGEPGCGPRPLRRGHDIDRGPVDVGGEGLVERLGVEVQVRALAPVRAGDRHGPDRRPHQTALKSLEELLDALALIGHPAVEVHQRLDLPVAGRRGRDDRATVGVADEHDETGQSPQEL